MWSWSPLESLTNRRDFNFFYLTESHHGKKEEMLCKGQEEGLLLFWMPLEPGVCDEEEKEDKKEEKR